MTNLGLIWDFIERSKVAASNDEIASEFLDIIARFGFTEFNALSLIGNPADTPAGAVRVLKYKPAWVAHYFDNRYQEIDPFYRHVLQATTPFVWEDHLKTIELSKRQKQLFVEAHEFDHRSGVTLPIKMIGAHPGVVSISSPDVFDPDSLPTVHLLSIYLFETLRRLAAEDARMPLPQPGTQLSPREAECLRWAAAGKTAWDIGVILAVSEATVREYIANAKRKFGVRTTVQAVVQAIASRQITL